MNILQLMRVAEEERDAQWLKESLQSAIELEHSTLPPYLCGMWSIKDTGSTAYSLVQSVLLEEMAHMGLVCNMLTTIGGSPQINVPGFVPTYPGPLPGDIRPELTVRLQGLTKEYIDQVYMQIEYPEQGPIARFRGESYPTIGAFYHAVLKAFETLVNSGAVTITGQNQLTSGVGGGVFAIKSLADVEKGINIIVEQGEGTSQSPDDGDGELAHYYKFAEIYHGKRLVKVGEEWKYEGDAIPFPDAYPMAVVPAGGYPGISDDFDKQYSLLLNYLHDAWNGGGKNSLSKAIGIMFGLADPAVELMQKPIDPNDPSKGNYGPSFRYLPG